MNREDKRNEHTFLLSEMTLVTGALQDEEEKWWWWWSGGGHTTIQQYVGVQFQINPLLFETNYIRQFANIEVITLAILTSGLKRVCFFIIYMFFSIYFGSQESG